MADTETPPVKTSKAGRNLPAAIAVSLLLSGLIIGTLILAPRGWVVILSVAMAIATHEVVKRLREAGYSIPLIPLLVGGQAMIWLTWPFGAAGGAGHQSSSRRTSESRPFRWVMKRAPVAPSITRWS